MGDFSLTLDNFRFNDKFSAGTVFCKGMLVATFRCLMVFFLLEIILRTGGFLYSSAQERHNSDSLLKKGVYKIMCVGESTTAYFQVKEPYPLKLERILNKENIKRSFTVINKGIIAANTSDILSQLNENLDKYKPDMVIAMMGINDCGYLVPQLKATSFWGQSRVYRLIKVIYLSAMQKLREYWEGDNKFDVAGNGMANIQKIYFEQHPPRQQSDRKIESEPCEEDGSVQKGLQYQDQGAYFLAEEAFKKALIQYPECGSAYFDLGRLYQAWTKFDQAEEAFRKGLKINPNDAPAYFGLGLALWELHKYSDTEASFKKSIELDPHQSNVFIMSGYFYRDTKNDIATAEKSFQHAIDVGSGNYMAYRELAKTYIRQRKYSQAEELFREFKARYPGNDRIYQDIIQLYDYKSREGSVADDQKKAEGLREACFWDVTAKNYRRMKRVLDERGIKLVCVQYPVRNIKPLIEIFEDPTGIVFVDNEKVFKDALRASRFDEYFTDMMFEDFGHCTEKGNSLLAGNIARVILTEVFRK